jgi:hypothetical protein
MGADADALPGEDQLRDAVEHVAMNIGPDGRRRQHIDDFTELLARAAAADYLEEGQHYKLVSTRKYDAETSLAWHMPSSFDAVKRYMRDYNVESEYSMLGRGDYVDNYADRADEAGSYPLATSHKVKGLDAGSKTVLIDVDRAEECLGTAFSLRSFTDGETEEEVSESSIEDEATPLDEIDAEANEGEYVSVTVEAEMDVKNSGLSDDGRPVLRASAYDETGEADVVSWDEHTEADQPKQPLTPWPDIEDGDQRAVFIDTARVDEYDGRLQLVLERGKTDVQPIQAGVGHTSPVEPEDEDQGQLDAAADGGQQTSKPKPPDDDRQGLRAEAEQLVEVLRGHANDEFSKPEAVAQASNVDGVDDTNRAEAVIEKAIKLGALARTGDDGGVRVL